MVNSSAKHLGGHNMIKSLILMACLFSFQSFAFADKDVSYILTEEWTRLRAHVENLEPEGDIGGYMNFKTYGKVTLLWRLSEDGTDNEVIRFYKNRKGDGHFAITYHKSDDIIDGKTVIRRFIGPEPGGWINHTIDYHTGEYLQRQGYFPELFGDEYKLMKEWNITPIRE